jgi:hypothetical protein
MREYCGALEFRGNDSGTFESAVNHVWVGDSRYSRVGVCPPLNKGKAERFETGSEE